ncbi:MAG: cold-shock protein [Dehalococcoidia bacterium]|nr:cold-shock protein [Dehalococcoidia bacterium]
MGVIRETGVDEDLFFHAGALVAGTFDRLSEGQAVEFERQPYRNSPSRARAVNVRAL